MKYKTYKTLVVLKALLQGQELEYLGIPISILQEAQIVFKLQKSDSLHSKTWEDHFVKCDITLNEFIMWINHMSDDEINIIAANVALNDLKISGRKSRNLPKLPPEGLGGSGETRG